MEENSIDVPSPMAEKSLVGWPGKSSTDGKHYPAVCHMLDVAAVAEVLVEQSSHRSHVKQAIVLLTALHDIGKISDSFRKAIEGTSTGQERRHWELSECLLHLSDDLLGQQLGNDPRQRAKLYAATAGHHGKPPTVGMDKIKHMERLVGNEAVEDSGWFIQCCCKIWPNSSLDGLSKKDVSALSWWLPGFVSVCDWIGSNTAWFHLDKFSDDISTHLIASREKARHAVEEAGLVPGALRQSRLFAGYALRPMQQQALDIAIPNGPVLAIIEDETGAGKTEAAFLLAQRMLEAGKGKGIYFALPTMATSNAMYKRARETVGDLFVRPSLTLAHGRANLNIDFSDVKGSWFGDDDKYSDRANVTCAPWLADSRRKALLAQVGVGTIDQALLAALPTKHNCMRLWGLSRSILIVDEVHELGNPYMEEELKSLLRAHAMQGGSAILLSATLPLRLRQKMADAFEEGAGRQSSALTDASYPALHIAGGESRKVNSAANPRGDVRVERVANIQSAATLLVDAAARGAACVWVRNSVDEAIAAKALLEEQGAAPILFHARFAYGDRQQIEMKVLETFGRNRAARSGQILVATQVVESSLDLDFDVMVSDLAPMAALIQRAGRLWRHMDERPATTRPVPEPVLHLLSPDPSDVTSSRWLKDILGKGEFVYNPAEQWRTANCLFKKGKIAAPRDLRALVEVVHGADVEDVPTALEKAEQEAMGKIAATRNLGQMNVIDFFKDYRSGGSGHDDVDYPTRLGPLQRTLMLVKRENGKLKLWWGEGAEGEMLSEVTASQHKLDKFAIPQAGEESSELQVLKSDWPEWKKRSVTVVEVGYNGRAANGLRYDRSAGLLFHNQNDE